MSFDLFIYFLTQHVIILYYYGCLNVIYRDEIPKLPLDIALDSEVWLKFNHG